MTQLPLGTVAMFVRALGSFAAFAPPAQAEKISSYANKAANVIELAGTAQASIVDAQAKLEADAEHMQRWVDTEYEPTEADFDQLEAGIDELHDRFQAAKSLG
jgi:hypothetical protein